MNNLYLSKLSTNATQLTTASIPFITATFYPISGFGAQGAPVYNTGALYLGNSSGSAPITIVPAISNTAPISGNVYKTVTTYTVNYNDNPTTNTVENLNNYFVTAQSALNTDGIYVLYV